MSEGSYIVEVWNQDGLFSGPGQVMAPSFRKAAITVMRNIGRPQLSAGGQPFVIHVQDLKDGTYESGVSCNPEEPASKPKTTRKRKVCVVEEGSIAAADTRSVVKTRRIRKNCVMKILYKPLLNCDQLVY